MSSASFFIAKFATPPVKVKLEAAESEEEEEEAARRTSMDADADADGMDSGLDSGMDADADGMDDDADEWAYEQWLRDVRPAVWEAHSVDRIVEEMRGDSHCSGTALADLLEARRAYHAAPRRSAAKADAEEEMARLAAATQEAAHAALMRLEVRAAESRARAQPPGGCAMPKARPTGSRRRSHLKSRYSASAEGRSFDKRSRRGTATSAARTSATSANASASPASG